MLKIGLTQRVKILPERSERWDCLDQAWTRLLYTNGFFPIPLPNLIEDVETYILELKLDGVILTGGNDLSHFNGAKNKAPERDVFEYRLLETCTKLDIPVLGVCRGMQIINDHYGGEIIPIEQHVATFHGLTVHSRNLLPLTDRKIVNSFHAFGMREQDLGNELQIIATAPDGIVEAISHKKLKQWGIMWHPERTPNDSRDLELIQAIFKK
ncbi:MAG: glutamine amidotransferase [Calditrichaeota bacterium]|nr:MAG: glutamine amidotransferase [Calditrichota bacterium]